MKKATIKLETLTCPSCMQKIENGIKSIDGVDIPSINVLFNSSKVIFNFDENKASIEDAENVIAKLGYEVKKSQVKDI
ncbi:MAG: heavy-metal-associated domain-containing protein [Tissierellales bacterium]|jgi:copper chaperone CopZ|nr:heavy-metal-associated domain-containing protein [Tissierellales bacterium]